MRRIALPPALCVAVLACAFAGTGSRLHRRRGNSWPAASTPALRPRCPRSAPGSARPTGPWGSTSGRRPRVRAQGEPVRVLGHKRDSRRLIPLRRPRRPACRTGGPRASTRPSAQPAGTAAANERGRPGAALRHRSRQPAVLRHGGIRHQRCGCTAVRAAVRVGLGGCATARARLRRRRRERRVDDPGRDPAQRQRDRRPTRSTSAAGRFPSIFGERTCRTATGRTTSASTSTGPATTRRTGGVTLNIDDDSLDGAVAAGVPSTDPEEDPSRLRNVHGRARRRKLARPRPSGAGDREPHALDARANACVGFRGGSNCRRPPLTTFAAVWLRFVRTDSRTRLVRPFSVKRSNIDAAATPPRACRRARPPATRWLSRESSGALTTAPAWFRLLRDVGSPTRATPTAEQLRPARFGSRGRRQDDSGTIARYQILRGRRPVVSVAGTTTSVAVRSLDVVALDAAGRREHAVSALLVVKRNRPADAPKAVPSWAWSCSTGCGRATAGAHPPLRTRSRAGSGTGRHGSCRHTGN